MGYNQQDSQEFLRYLLEGLHEDVNRVSVKTKPLETDIPDNLRWLCLYNPPWPAPILPTVSVLRRDPEKFPSRFLKTPNEIIETFPSDPARPGAILRDPERFPRNPADPCSSPVDPGWLWSEFPSTTKILADPCGCQIVPRFSIHAILLQAQESLRGPSNSFRVFPRQLKNPRSSKNLKKIPENLTAFRRILTKRTESSRVDRSRAIVTEWETIQQESDGKPYQWRNAKNPQKNPLKFHVDPGKIHRNP